MLRSLVDGDDTVESLFRFLGERESDGGARAVQSPRGVQVFRLHGKLDARDKLVNDVLQRGTDLVIVDMPATALTMLREFGEDYYFMGAVATAGYRLSVMAPITPYDDTLLDLQETIALLDPEAFDAQMEAVRLDCSATALRIASARSRIVGRMMMAIMYHGVRVVYQRQSSLNLEAV